MIKHIAIAFLLSNTAFGQTIIVTDRPDATESALTIPFKSIQIESGTTYQNDRKMKQINLPEYLLRVGISNFLEFRLENALHYLYQHNSYLFSDLFFGFKAQIVDKKRIGIAFLSHINLPENERNNFLLITKLLLSYSFNNNANIGLNLGLDNYNKRGNEEFTFALAYGQGVSKKISFFIETFGNISTKKELISFIDGGFTYLINNKIQVDYKLGIDTQHFENYFSGIGISLLFLRKKSNPLTNLLLISH